jgi:trans-2-enoyl-CoA reductase
MNGIGESVGTQTSKMWAKLGFSKFFNLSAFSSFSRSERLLGLGMHFTQIDYSNKMHKYQ